MPKRKFLSRAFTLIELLVVIVVIAILASLLMPVLSSVMKKGHLTQAINNMRQVGIAFQLYSGDNNYQLPGRQSDAASTSTPKWPALLAGTDGSGTANLTTNYVGDVKVYIAPGDNTIDPNRPDLFAFLTNNSSNNTSWIMNGYDDLGTKTNPSVQIRTVIFTSPVNTILLGVQDAGAQNFYMDFTDGDNTDVLNLSMYNGGSPYLFADGSVQFITQVKYLEKPAPQGTSDYGDWLWLSDKSSNVPASQ